MSYGTRWTRESAPKLNEIEETKAPARRTVGAIAGHVAYPGSVRSTQAKIEREKPKVAPKTKAEIEREQMQAAYVANHERHKAAAEAASRRQTDNWKRDRERERREAQIKRARQISAYRETLLSEMYEHLNASEEEIAATNNAVAEQSPHNFGDPDAHEFMLRSLRQTREK